VVRPALAATRAVAVLDFFAAHPGSAYSLSELSDCLGVNLASLLSVLQALEDGGQLTRHPKRKTYELGPAPVALGAAALRANPAVDLARTEIRRLAAHFDTEALVSAVVGAEIVILAAEGRPRLQSADVRVGQRIPLIPPIGQVFHAWAGPAEVDGWLSRLDPSARAVAGIHLPVALAAVRGRGYSVSLESPVRVEIGRTLERIADRPRDAPMLRDRLAEYTAALGGEDYELLEIAAGSSYDITTVVAPVFDAQGRVTLAMTVNGTGNSTGAEIVTLGESLGSAARTVTRASGGRPPV
jgi:DNA-binding IclR family transcriptional regulator